MDLVSIKSLITVVTNWACLIAQYFVMFVLLYYLVISLFGWFKRRSIPAEKYPAKNRFALIVAAHNEEAVVGSIVRNLKRLNYPKHLYDVYVIADNCNDNTANIASSNGAIVYERFDMIKKGKGYSLQWMFKKLFKLDKKYDAICIFDADNLASQNFLLEMNKQLHLGNKVVQGYLDSKNPEDSWISGNYSLAYWIANRLFQLPRHYLGLNCALGGTGFMVSTDVLQDIGWDATCLTEDLEFSIKLVLKGLKVSWSHEAVIYDEKPLKMRQSWKQRKRWMQGHCDCAVRYLKSVMKKALRDRDIVAFDCGMYLVQPLLIVANVVISLLFTIRYILNGGLNLMFEMPLEKMVLYCAFFLFTTYFNIVFVIAERKFSLKILKYFLIAPIYSLTWVPIIIQGFFERNNREWVHTIHTRALDIDALEKTG